MLSSSLPAAVRAGARLVALAGLRLDEARGDAGLVLEAVEHARLGAAEIYARNLSNETVGAECEQKLRTLFGDASEAVRREASRCWIALEPDQIASRGSLIGAFAQSLGLMVAWICFSIVYRKREGRYPSRCAIWPSVPLRPMAPGRLRSSTERQAPRTD